MSQHLKLKRANGAGYAPSLRGPLRAITFWPVSKIIFRTMARQAPQMSEKTEIESHPRESFYGAAQATQIPSASQFHEFKSEVDH